MKTSLIRLFVLTGMISISFTLSHSQESQYRPELAFREDWKEIPAEIPVTQHHVQHPDLLLQLYGPGKDSIKKSNHEKPIDDPFYIWSGRCQGNWALTLKHQHYYLDLSGYSKIKWRSKQAGVRQLHILLKLEDGSWLVSKQGDPASVDWRMKEFNLQEIDWFSVDMTLISEQIHIPDPDLTKVDEIGFTDLMTGGNSVACSRLDWIEVYGQLVGR